MPRSKKRASSSGAVSHQSRSDSQGSNKQLRQATLYDAVAGRVSTQGFIPTIPHIPTTRDLTSTSTKPLPPEKVLMSRGGAPDDDADDSIYWADKHLTPAQELPESDLLKAIHAYAADYYGRVYGDEAVVDYQSLDETALIAMGVLLEEMADRVLGETGHLAFVEEEEEEEEAGPGGPSREPPTAPVSADESAKGDSAPAVSGTVVSTPGEGSGEERGRKRRKTKHGC